MSRGAARDRRPVQLLGASLVAVLAAGAAARQCGSSDRGQRGMGGQSADMADRGWLAARPLLGRAADDRLSCLYLQFCRAVLPLPVRVLLALVLAGRGAGARVDRAVLGSRGFSVVPSEPRVWLDKVRTILRPLASPLAPGRPHRLLAGLIGLCAVWSIFGFGASRAPSRRIRFHLIVTTGDAGSQAQAAGHRFREGPNSLVRDKHRSRLAAVPSDGRTSENTLRDAFDLFRPLP